MRNQNRSSHNVQPGIKGFLLIVSEGSLLIISEGSLLIISEGSLLTVSKGSLLIVSEVSLSIVAKGFFLIGTLIVVTGARFLKYGWRERSHRLFLPGCGP